MPIIKLIRQITWQINPVLKVLLVCMVSGIFFVPSISHCSGGEKEGAKVGFTQEELDEMRVVIYTKEFAERFGLPAPETGNEPSGGVEAMEFSVEKGLYNSIYYCYLKIYIKSSIEIKYPEKSRSGSLSTYLNQNHFFSWPRDKFRKWKKEDREHFLYLSRQYGMKVFFASAGYASGNGFIDSLLIEEFNQELLPGLSYLKVNVLSYGLPDVSQYWPIELWLEREEGPDYSNGFKISSTDFIHLQLLKIFYQKIKTHINEVKKMNGHV